jgi:DNA-binding GntR family transcriptional regulator
MALPAGFRPSRAETVQDRARQPGRRVVFCIQSTLVELGVAMANTLAHLEAPPDLVDRAYRALLDAISDGTLAPGQRLTQEEIAAQLAVSRQPVLQALRLLKAERFVHDAPGRGVQVAPLDARWIEQVYEVRTALDAQAARLAARRVARARAAPLDSPGRRGTAPPMPVIDPTLMSRGRAAVRRGRLSDLIDADLAFHHAIYDAADNPLLAQSAEQHWRHIRRAMGAVLQVNALRTTVWDEHEAIAAAINDGDGERAARLMLGHGEGASHHLATQLPTAGPTTSAKETTGDKP